MFAYIILNIQFYLKDFMLLMLLAYIFIVFYMLAHILVGIMFRNNKIYKIDKNGKKRRIFFILGLKVSFKGKNATVIIHEPYIKFKKSKFILGDNSKIEIQGSIYKSNRLFVDMNARNSECLIGKNFSSSKNCSFLIYVEPNLKIVVGNECMFGEDVTLRTSDAHRIYNNKNEIINKGKDILIKNHCWLATDVIILKGVTIEENSVVATKSVVTKNLEFKNSLYAGIPCALKKKGINWDRKPIKKFDLILD